jgi:integrase
MPTNAPDRMINFTKRAIEALPSAAPGTRDYYLDEKSSHLGVAITPRGTKSFFIQRRLQGKPTRMIIGRFPEVTIDQARRKAAALNMEIAAGLDPYERTKPARTGLTFGEFFESEYLVRHARAHKKTWKQDADLFRLHLGGIARTKLGTVTRRDLQQIHVAVGAAAGKRTANLVVGLVHAVYVKAREWSFFEGTNPAAGIRKFREHSRDRYLLPDEVPRFFAALSADVEEQGTATWRDFFLLALFTGARRSNVLAMRWANIDLDGATWTIPRDETKTGTTYRLPLSQIAVEILRYRRGIVGDDAEWVFPSDGRRGHLVEPKAAWERIRRRSGLRDLRIHDLRRTLGSWQAAAGASLPIIGRSLGHLTPATTQVYARLDLDPVRQSVESAGAALMSASLASTAATGARSGDSA